MQYLPAGTIPLFDWRFAIGLMIGSSNAGLARSAPMRIHVGTGQMPRPSQAFTGGIFDATHWVQIAFGCLVAGGDLWGDVYPGPACAAPRL